jgi:hypothetical protein
MPTPPKESAKFVFEGVVKRTKAANLAAIRDTGRTVVVTVEKIVRAPRSLASFAGHDVTVRLAEGARIKKGQRAVFHTNGWIFGENLAVQSLGHDLVSRSAAAAEAAVAAPDPIRAAALETIRERAAAAPVVLTGKVVAVGLPQSEAEAAPAVAGATTAEPPAPSRISEHEPFWREAVVEVHAVHKGTVGKQQVVLRFPSSTDVRWHRAPKFRAGQEGVFSLRQDDISGHTTVGPAAESFAAEAAYTALHSADFQPLEQETEVAAAVSAAQN